MLKALEVQGRVIKALFLREIKTRFGEKRLGFLWAFLEPAVHVMVLVTIWKVLGRMGPPGIHPIMFMFTGIIPFLMFRNIVNKGLGAVSGNKALLVFPQIQPIDLVLSRMLLEFATYTIVLIGFLLGARYIGFEYQIEDILGVTVSFVFIALLGGGFGMTMMAISAAIPLMSTATKILMRVMYFTSGVFFSIDRLPHYVRPYLSWNPMMDLLHMFRADFFPQIFKIPEFSNLAYVTFVIMFFWLLGFILVKRLFKYILEA